MDTIKTESCTAPLAGVKLSPIKWALLLLPFAWLWFHLVNNLRLEWTTDPQYSYSLVVPILIVGLLMRRWYHFSKIHLPGTTSKNSGQWIFMAACLALLYLPTRLIEEATPEWRPIGWLLAIQTIGFTLYGIYLVMGRAGLTRLAFPICFFFTAVPWPTLFEHPIIQGLGRVNANMVVNVLGIIGIPAIQHGNVIEISTGMVGINDACSGIRSIQSSLMISLFLGEYYFLSRPRRVVLVLSSFMLAMFFNLCRTSLLTYIAATKGPAAIAQYHDEAGMTILLACTATLWGVGHLFSLRQKPVIPAAGDIPKQEESNEPGRRAFRLLASSLIVWVVLVEAGVGTWYAIREAKIKPGPKWTMVLPEDNASFKALPFTPEERQLLRFDDGKQGQWREPDGAVWQVFYFNWLPGRVAGYLAKRHTPDICLPATGLTMLDGPTLTMLKVNNVDLPVRSYVFGGPNGTFHVFQCHWEPGADSAGYVNESSRYNLVRGVWAGRGDKGQKVIEMVVVGYDNMEAAKQALVHQLEKLIRVE